MHDKLQLSRIDIVLPIQRHQYIINYNNHGSIQSCQYKAINALYITVITDRYNPANRKTWIHDKLQLSRIDIVLPVQSHQYIINYNNHGSIQSCQYKAINALYITVITDRYNPANRKTWIHDKLQLSRFDIVLSVQRHQCMINYNCHGSI